MSKRGTQSALKTGVAFSGGGIRSAALCSGVLRRLLQRNVEPDYLSCVSGGGYTGASYLDWKYRKEKEWELQTEERAEHQQEEYQRWQREWHRQFFDQMRSRAGLLCNWQKPLQGILDTLVLCLLVLFVSVIIPIVGWGSFACPLAIYIDLAFGTLLNAKRYNETSGGNIDFPSGSVPFERMLVFVVPLLCFVAFYVYYISKCKWGRGLARFMSILSGSLFLFTFLPWFIDDYLVHTPALVEGAVVVVSSLIGFFFPLFRRYSLLAIIVYAFAYMVYWRVYEGIFFGIQYNQDLFMILLLASEAVQLFTSIFGKCHLHLVHVYNRWRLQKAFFYDKGTGRCGCSGIGCSDIFPAGLYNCAAPSCTDGSGSPENTGALNLADLENITPRYISNIVVNGWQLDGTGTKYGLLTMSPEKIERIDCQTPIVLAKREKATPAHAEKMSDPAGSTAESNILTDVHCSKLRLKDVKLSEAMATSAAAVSTRMGSYGDSYKNILTILGLEMGASMVYNMESKREYNCGLKAIRLFVHLVLPYLIRLMSAVPLFVLIVLYVSRVPMSNLTLSICVGAHFMFNFIIALFTVMHTGGSEGCYNKMARWLIIHVPFCQFMRSIFKVIDTGLVPPAVLRLSDGGHIENLAILPLFRERLQRIVVVNGGYTVPDSTYGEAIVHALGLAREHLNCSFSGMDGRDVIEDIKCKFGMDDHPRSYRFKVDYYDKDKKEIIGKGEVILLAPRPPPTKGTQRNKGCDDKGESIRMTLLEPDRQWSDLEAGSQWGFRHVLDDDDVNDLQFCCECRHVEIPRKCRNVCCGVFPQHKTSNQFFTPAVFSAYHREGYRACLEAAADVFLEEDVFLEVAEPVPDSVCYDSCSTRQCLG